MFDELDNGNTAPGSDARSAGPMPKRTEDIFSEVDKVVKPEVLRPRDINSSPAIGTVIPADEGWLKNKGLIAGLIFGGLVIVVGGYFGLRLMVKSTAPINIETKKEEVNNDQLTPEVQVPAAEEVNNLVNQPILPTLPQSVDSDQDGLTDEEEARLGTSPNNPDTDQDGLTDREEVQVYGTDPLKLDTDADGYTDGDEIRNNYNPIGPGKLYEINQ